MSKRYYQKNLKKNSVLFCIAFCFISIAYLHGQEGPPEPKPVPDAGDKRAATGHFDIEAGFERYFFYTRYQIGGKTYGRTGAGILAFPISELKFPLEAFMAYADLNLNIMDRLDIHCSVRKNLHNRVGKMEDSDWVPFPGFKTVYSESDARLNAVITEADLVLRLFTVSVFSLKLGAGFTHQYLYYWCSNLLQYSIYDSSLPPPYLGDLVAVKIPGKDITYEVQYYMMTMQITPVFTVPIKSGTMEITAALQFSPYLKARDHDRHVLRGKESKGDTKGTAFMPFLRVRYLFSNRIFITARLDYLVLNTHGWQTQSYYNPLLDPGSKINGVYVPGWSARIEHKLKSEQLSVSLGAGYSLEF